MEQAIWSEAEGGKAAYCQHNVDSQVHCCVCHSGFVFDGMQHEPDCPFSTTEPDIDHDQRNDEAAAKWQAQVDGSVPDRFHVHMIVETAGDPTVGIPATREVLHLASWAPFHDDASERERLRGILAKAFTEVYDEPASVRFGDECPDCGRFDLTHTDGCPIAREAAPA